MASRGKKKNPDKIRITAAETKSATPSLYPKGIKFDSFNRKSQKWLVLAVALLCAIMFALPMLEVEILLDDTTKNLLGGAETDISFSAPSLMGLAFSGYDDSFEYLMDNIPALKRAVELGQEKTVTAKVTTKLRAQLNAGYAAIAVLSAISALAFLALLIIALLDCAKVKIPPLLRDLFVYACALLAFIVFIVLFYAQMQGTKDVAINIGAGFGLMLLFIVSGCAYVVTAAVWRNKINKAEGLASGQKM